MTTKIESGAAPFPGDELLTDAQLAKLLHVDGRTTLRWRTEGGGPPFIRVGARRVLYARTAVDEWLAARTFPHRAAEAVGQAAR